MSTYLSQSLWTAIDMEIWSEEPDSSSLLAYVTNWIRVLVISGSYIEDKNNNTPLIHNERKYQVIPKLNDIYSQFSSTWWKRHDIWFQTKYYVMMEPGRICFVEYKLRNWNSTLFAYGMAVILETLWVLHGDSVLLFKVGAPFEVRQGLCKTNNLTLDRGRPTV